MYPSRQQRTHLFIERHLKIYKIFAVVVGNTASQSELMAAILVPTVEDDPTLLKKMAEITQSAY